MIPVDSKLASQQNGGMKTTVDLPEALVKQIKLRAKLVRDKRTGVLVVTGGRSARPGQELTPHRIHEILLAEEMERLIACEM